MRPIYCGNLPLDARWSDVECLFGRHGRVVSVNMQSGFAIVYMEDELDAQGAIMKLNCSRFGRKGSRLCVEWTRDDCHRSRTNSPRPSKTLLVMNFDPVKTRSRNIENYFAQYGKVTFVLIRKNFAFVEFEFLEDASRAVEATHMSNFMDQVISVDYAVRYNDNKMNSPDRRRGQNEYRGSRIDNRECSPNPSCRDDADDDVVKIPTSIVNVFVCVFFLFLLYAF